MKLRRFATLASLSVIFLAADATHAVTYTATLLGPLSGIKSSLANGVSGNSQVGSDANAGSGYDHATLWSGTAASAIDLHPTGFINSVATGVTGNIQVGWGSGGAIGIEGTHSFGMALLRA